MKYKNENDSAKIKIKEEMLKSGIKKQSQYGVQSFLILTNQRAWSLRFVYVVWLSSVLQVCGFPPSNVNVAFLWKITINRDIKKSAKKGTVTVWRAVEFIVRLLLLILINQGARARCLRVAYVVWLSSILQVCGLLPSNGIKAFLWKIAINGDI